MNTEAILKALEEHEGCIEHMYQCTGGRVTAGIGHAFSTADEAAAAMFCRAGGAPAPREEIMRDFEAVRNADPDRTADFYRQFTRLRMNRSAIDELARRDVETFAAKLRSRVPEFDALPEPAQEALFDMAYNLGVDGLLKKFPKMMAAVGRRDWETAAQECERGGISAARNAWTAARFRSC
jgi:GH24 family phage-related lysozyme (muramidase)